MILLDTNVLSALIRDAPDPIIVDWLNRQVPDEIWTTAVTIFVVRFGLARLPLGRKRQNLAIAFDALIVEGFLGRVAVFDRAAADAAGLLAARREASGRPVDFRDTFIAGIAIARGASVATRNLRHFGDLGTGAFDPWQAP